MREQRLSVECDRRSALTSRHIKASLEFRRVLAGDFSNLLAAELLCGGTPGGLQVSRKHPSSPAGVHHPQQKKLLVGIGESVPGIPGNEN